MIERHGLELVLPPTTLGVFFTDPVSYYQDGTLDFQTYAGNNPRLTQSLFLNPGMTGFNPGGLNLSSPLPALNTFPASFSPPFPQSLFTFGGTNLATTLPNLHVPYVENWMFGVQRELASNTVLEMRYVGNKGVHGWHGYNQNEVNIFENGFLNDFVDAQNNLRINTAAGVTNSFANRGLAGQVATPILDAAFGPLGAQPALAASAGYGNGTFITQLQQGQAGAMANSLAGSPTYLCRMVGSALPACGTQGFTATGVYPINFFQENPFNAGAETRLLTDYSYSTYNSLQVELHRRAGRLTVQGSYTLSHSIGDLFAESASGFMNYTTIRNRGLDKAPSVFDIRHAGVSFVSLELPFGKGHKLSSSVPGVNRVVGGWTISNITRLQTGRPFRLISGRSTFNSMDAGVLLNGVTTNQLQEMLTIRPGPNKNISYVSPNLVGADGRANPAILGTPTTPGQLGQLIYLYGPHLLLSDIAVTKAIPVTERVKIEFVAEALNAFNHPQFLIGNCSSFLTTCSSSQGVLNSINSTTFGQNVNLAVDPRNIQLRLVLRF
jgi:hypothetical protein